MSPLVAILGRQPALGIAELESQYGPDYIYPIGQNAVLINKEPGDIDFNRLGGTLKLATVLTTIKTAHWPEIEKYLAQTIPKHLHHVPEGKLKLGISVYGHSITPARINATSLSLKKVIKASGRSVRVIPNKDLELNTAQVIYNQLTGSNGWELLLIKDGESTIIAQTRNIQDIQAYAARDQVRPKRDAKVGMLPPKLAQIIINLARPEGQATILDPFCGTGVVLQEAMLMGYDIYGTDLDNRMVDYTEANLTWLNNGHKGIWNIHPADATINTWSPSFDNIAAETYLGRPFSALPKPEILQNVVRDVEHIHAKFLKNVARQTNPGFKMCIAVPAWKTKNGFVHLKTLDSLEELGYTRVSFVHANNSDLIYHRPEQIVGRELVVLNRI